MEELKNKIDNQIEKLKEMILKNESKDEISNQKKNWIGYQKNIQKN